MKDYTLFNDDNYYHDDFILGYEINGDNIIIKYTNGIKQSIKYNIDNEQRILGIMEKQATDSFEMIEKIDKKITSLSLAASFDAFNSMMSISLLSSNNDIKQAVPTLLWSIAVISPSALLLRICIILKGIKAKNDIKKNELFLENQYVINRYIRKDAIKRTASKKTIDRINNTDNSKPVLDINTIDGMPLSELRRISSSINQYLSLGLSDETSKENTINESVINRSLKPKNS